MVNEESFGERKARERAERKRQIRKEKELKALERAMNEYKNGKKDKQTKEKPIPKVEWLPKIEPKPLSDTFDIDWEDNLTVTASDDLFKRIINGYIRGHKIDHLDGLVIIDLEQVVTSSDEKVQIIVTAQARDYFQYDNKPESYNQQIREDTNIERFKEIWTLVWKDETNLQLCNIKTIG